MKQLSQSEKEQLRSTISAAREGRATLPQLASAYELASAAILPGCMEEIRGHMQRRLSVKAGERSVGRDLLLGLTTGTIAHYLLKGH
jgi:hypothetical protein